MLAVLLAGLLAQSPAPSVAVTLEPRVESFRYRFESPSNFDTVELVPHFFEQRYDTDHLWVGVRGRYRLRGLAAETTAALTPQTTARADDFDTFFQPGGNIVVTGTTGNASLRAWDVSQRLATAGAGTFSYGIGYSYRRDSARYHEGTRITTTTTPPSELREPVTTREFVTSHLHQVLWFGRWRASPAWTLGVDAAPFALGHLAIELPDKYPGQTLGFRARAAILGAEAAVHWPVGAIGVEIAARANRSFSYSNAASLHVSGAAVVVRLGTR